MPEQDKCFQIRSSLEEFKKEIRDNLNYYFGFDYVVNSKASNEINGSPNIKDLTNAYNQGSILIQVALDHFSAFTRTIGAPALTISPWANVRGVIEASAISSWLLDTGIDVNERISRSYAFRIDGLEEQVKYAHVINKLDIEEHSKRRLAYVQDKANKLGLTEIGKKGKPKLVLTMPDITTLVRNQLNEEPEYRLFSAMVHAHNWAMLQLGFTPVIDVPDGKLVKQQIGLVSIAYISVIAINSIYKSILQKYDLYGWPHDDLKISFDKVRKFLRDCIPVP
jgi:hypothetical protein